MKTQHQWTTPCLSRWALVATLLLAVMIGCGEDSSGPQPADSTDGADLLGLVDGRTFVYLRTDSLRDSQFVLHVYEALDTVTINGSGEDWSVTATGQPKLSLKVTGDIVLQNGYWPEGLGSSVVYFAQPPVLMPRRLETDQTWEGRYPSYRVDGDDYQRLFLYSYFGFYYTRTNTGNVQLTLPAGSFTAYCFEVALYQNDADIAPLAKTREYFVPGVGLVRHVVDAGAFKRTLSLVSYD